MTTPAPVPGQPGEVTGLASALAYAGGMTRAYADAACGAERFAAGLGRQGVDGAVVAAVGRARELTAQAEAAWVEASTAVDRQSVVREAYATAPEAGGKEFVTDVSPTAAAAVTGSPATSIPESTMPEQPQAVRIKTDDTEQSDVVVVPCRQGTIRIELAADAWELTEGIGPVVELDEAGTAALAEAAAVMAAAEKAARAAHRKRDSAIGRLERRREQIRDRPYKVEGYAALSRQFDELWTRIDAVFGQMRRQMPPLDSESRTAFGDLEAQLKGGDRQTIRAAQRHILRAAGVRPDDPYFATQAEFDDLHGRQAEIRRQAETFPIVPRTPSETAEIERITVEITAAESALADLNEEQQLASGDLPTVDGSVLAWRTTSEEGRIEHRLERRAAAGHAPEADDGWEIPRLTGKQLGRVIQAVTGARQHP